MVKWPIIRKLTATLILLLLVVLLNAEVTYNCTVKLIEAQTIAFDSERVIVQLERIISSFKDIEILQSQYLLTKNTRKFYEASFLAHRDILEHIQNLEQLTLERPQLQQHIAVLKQQINNNLNLLLSDINSEKENLNPATDLENLNDSGHYSRNQSMEKIFFGADIQQLIKNIEVGEENLLKQHIDRFHNNLQQTDVIFLIAIVINLLLTLLLYYFCKNYISQLQEAELAKTLRDSSTRERANLLDIAIDAISLQNIREEILYWNQGAENLYGWTSHEVVGKHISKLLDSQVLTQQKQALEIVIEQGEWRGELTQVSKNGKEITVESIWTLVKDESGKPKSILTIDREITRKKELEAALLRSQRLESIGTLAGGIAHDLNNILAPILMSVQLLQIRFNDEQNQQLLKTLEKNVQRGANLVKQVLLFARGMESKQTIVEVKQLISEIEQIVTETFPKSIDCKTIIPERLGCVCGDMTQLHQVLVNLVLNARDAMPDGGNLNISATNITIDEHYTKMNVDARVGDYVVITVADVGIGISSQIKERIFEPFFTTKKIGQGTGLGLSTALGIVRNHGGFVNVYSELGKGTQFQVYLPSCSQKEKTTHAVELEVLGGEGELILVVDDEAAIREATKSSLEIHNYQVMTASDGVEAVSVYAQYQQSISVVLLDMMMPIMDGSLTIRTLQKINSAVKIIGISGLLSNQNIAENAGVGVKAFLSKPCTAKELLQTINLVISGDI
ncbi:ATP-binding protein [Mastigocoleus testarum]|uniref:histidine kinase n=1 Tax=Mastigocoleus testarum BC008 TaxID=371196 RepID=A0A0V7ZPI6_9CYAN|nr:ATP-binding protein [Mastigocoleus testarum]KST66597.1 hypothetical protein BC008_43565 [Mastigocoleus testarum BC008]